MDIYTVTKWDFGLPDPLARAIITLVKVMEWGEQYMAWFWDWVDNLTLVEENLDREENPD